MMLVFSLQILTQAQLYIPLYTIDQTPLAPRSPFSSPCLSSISYLKQGTYIKGRGIYRQPNHAKKPRRIHHKKSA
ncbi:hypothetical protein B0T21DRAFT_356685 [Apiosordaria backusii]|uniref:Uncharacterized protein n=1 Tax=Apiosordaria backusii TaxID=314023 RepID=A0AA40F025_9PEZI|nr:hypothetical protein B0T21DRAFT_356685 [Apiosordaria backusii]